MAAISAAEVKSLRERTGAGMMDCKKALVEAEGDVERALDLLRERGLGKARGKADRATSEGRIIASVSDDGSTGALVELNCETDFVARTDDFGALCDQVADHVRQQAPADIDAFLAMDWPGGGTVKDALAEAVLKLGENLRVSRFSRLVSDGARIGSYIHAGGKIGALVQVEGEGAGADAFTHNVCMHIAASNPSGVSRDEIDGEEIDRERRILRAQAEGEGKPDNIIDKMVEGRLSKFFKEVVLLEQPLVMDPDTTVGDAAKSAGVEVVAFRRFQLGEEAVE
ncbi:MAG: elongation factor Ts [Deltaproteobacteria bacterium]|nr:elongation factor Ts [Deltaproteobacteria bacterium]